MEGGKFESQEERLRFLERAGDEGVYIRLQTPIPCSSIYPEPCLNLATAIHAYYSPVAGWNFSTSLCRECAIGMAKLYKE